MKKVILVGLLLVSWLGAKSIEQVQNDWRTKITAKTETARQKWWQNDEVQRLMPHCQQGDKNACKRVLDLSIKFCNNGEAFLCGMIVSSYCNGDETMNISPDLKKAQSYADKVCYMDAVYCAGMSGCFMYKDRKLALKYAEKACEMGEISDCVVAAELYAVGFGGVGKNPQKVKYYTDKLCKGGVSEACGK